MPGETLRVVLGAAAGTEIQLDDLFTLGRTESGDGSLGGDPELSRQHARISRTPDGALEITDLGSTNGTHVNGVRIGDSQRLGPGDTIRVGQTTLNVHGEPTGPAADRTVIGAAPPGAGAPPAEPPPLAQPPAPPPAEEAAAPVSPPPFEESAPPAAAPASGEAVPPPVFSEPTPPPPSFGEPSLATGPPAIEEAPQDVSPDAPPIPDPVPPSPTPGPGPGAPPRPGLQIEEPGPFAAPAGEPVPEPEPASRVPFAPPGRPAPAGDPGTQVYPPAPAAYGGPPVAAPPAGPPVPTAGSDASAYALKRPIGRQILLFFLSFGLWSFYWFYDTRKKLNAELGKQDDAAVKTACMLIPIYNLVLIYQLWEDLNGLRTRNFGLPEYNSAVLLIVAVIVPFGIFYSYPKVATELNQYWDVRTQGRAIEAPVTTIEKVLAGVGAAILALYVLVIVIVIIAAAAGN